MLSDMIVTFTAEETSFIIKKGIERFLSNKQLGHRAVQMTNHSVAWNDCLSFAGEAALVKAFGVSLWEWEEGNLVGRAFWAKRKHLRDFRGHEVRSTNHPNRRTVKMMVYPTDPDDAIFWLAWTKHFPYDVELLSFIRADEGKGFRDYWWPGYYGRGGFFLPQTILHPVS